MFFYLLFWVYRINLVLLKQTVLFQLRTFNRFVWLFYMCLLKRCIANVSRVMNRRTLTVKYMRMQWFCSQQRVYSRVSKNRAGMYAYSCQNDNHGRTQTNIHSLISASVSSLENILPSFPMSILPLFDIAELNYTFTLLDDLNRSLPRGCNIKASNLTILNARFYNVVYGF